MSDIDEIKTKLNIVDIVGSRVTLKKTGRNFKGLCPFHEEKTPSFIVSPDRQTFHCFGCGKGGSIFDFVMLTDHIDFSEALETLAERAGVKLERRQGDTPEAKRKQKIFEANHLASEYYAYLLTKHAVGAVARDYLKDRGVSDKSITTFALGYSTNTWDGLLLYLRKKGFDDSLLALAGLVIAGNRGYYDRFRGRVMFTLKDHRGNVVGFSGRVLDPEAKEAKYINTSETPVYTKGKVLYGLDVTRDAIQKANEAVIMEGELDVISSFQAGIPNVVAIKGSAVTENHVQLLRRYTERLVFALDSDMAGDQAARRGIEIADKSGFDMRVARMPSGKDPDEAARVSPGLFKKALKDAEPIYDYFLSSAMSRFDTKTSFGKRKVSEEFLPVLFKIENTIVQGHYVRALADALELPENVVQESLIKFRLTGGKSIQEIASNEKFQQPLSRLEKAELYMLALLVQGNTQDLYPVCIAAVSVDCLHLLPVQRIIELMGKFLTEQKSFDAKIFVEALPVELVQTFDEAFLWDISDFLEQDERFLREWKKAIHEVKRSHLRFDMEEISRKLRDTLISEDDHDALQQKLKSFMNQLVMLEKGV